MYSFGPHYFGPSRTAVTEMHFLHHALVVKKKWWCEFSQCYLLPGPIPLTHLLYQGAPEGPESTQGRSKMILSSISMRYCIFSHSCQFLCLFHNACDISVPQCLCVNKYKWKYLYWGVRWFFTHGRLIKFGKQCLLEEFCRDQGYKKLHFFQGFGLLFSIKTISPVTKRLSFLALAARNLRARFRTQPFLQNARGCILKAVVLSTTGTTSPVFTSRWVNLGKWLNLPASLFPQCEIIIIATTS